MAPISATTVPSHRSGSSLILRHGERGVWALMLLALVHTALFATITDPRAPFVVWIRMLQPLAAVGAVVLLALVAQSHTMRRVRLAWALFAVGVATSGIGALAQIVNRDGFSYLCFAATYLAQGLAIALLIPSRSWIAGHVVRIVLDAFTVGVSVFVVVFSLLPVPLHGTARASVGIALIYVAADAGILFAVLLTRYCYEPGSSPLLTLGVLCMVCLFASEVIYMQVTLLPLAERDAWIFVVGPLLTLHRAVLALMGVRSLTMPPRAVESFVQADVVPVAPWLTWMVLPNAVACMALFSAAVVGRTAPTALALLVVCVLVRNVLAVYDVRRVFGVLALAREQEAQSRHQLLFFTHELRGYATELAGLTPRIAHYLRVDAPPATLDIRARFAQALTTTTTSLQDLLQHVLLLTRPDARPRDQQTLVPLAPLVTTVLTTVAAISEQSGVHIAQHVAPGAAMWGDARTLTLALRTLCQNAIEAMAHAPEATLTVRAWSDDDHTVVRVEDTGPGFTADLLDDLQATRRREGSLPPRPSHKPHGHGIGLVSVEQMTRQIGGVFTFGNRTGQRGAWVELRLPHTPPSA